DAGVGGQELHRRLIGGGRRDDDRVLERSVLPKLVHDLSDRGLLLADGHVDAVNATALLVDDRVDRDGRLAGLTVADNELALAAPDRDHGVDRLKAGLERLLDRLPFDNPGRLNLDLAELLAL